MGRPNRRSDSKPEGKIYGTPFCDKKKDKKSFYKSEFQKQIGNSKTGQGFAALQKKKILKQFNRTFKRKKNQITSPVAIKPLSNIEDSFLQPLSSTEDSLLQDTLSDCSANDTIKTEISSDSRISADVPESLSKKSKTKRDKKRGSQIIRSSSQRIEIDYEKINEERRKKSEEIRANIKKHDQAVAKSLEKRKILAKRLNKKTSRGQPVMATRMELLYEKISKR